MILKNLKNNTKVLSPSGDNIGENEKMIITK